VNETDAPPLAATSALYERWTRRLGRAGAFALALATVLPGLEWSEGSAVWKWFWEPPRGRDGFVVVPIYTLPDLVALLVIAAIGWVAAGLKPLARRGRWLTCSTALCLAILANQYAIPGHEWRFSWPLGWQFLPLFLATLGLALAATPAHRPLGRLLCMLGGICLLGLFLFPTRVWEWHFLHLLWHAPDYLGPAQGLTDRESLAIAYRMSLGLWLIAAPLLVLAGWNSKRTRTHWRMAVWAVTAAITSGWVRDFMVAFALHEGPHAHATVGLNVLKWQAHSCGQVLLLGTGLFAWIVGAREERVAEAVFD
jgi:hypothetical protein